ncbi:Ger(x)C family spore germination protein [Bacillus sp. SCS-153A]|uniref:Ger(x)C family spore germination protein n=1 Tax=Rossellomorea sedimentorum TaxID=3115294 RepID=UPI00390610D7
MKKMILIIIICILSLLSGCYDKKELEEKAYVVAIGIDKAKKKNQYFITFQIANPEVGSSVAGGDVQEEPQENVTLLANDFLTARNTANSFITREISVDHTRALIISEEMARSEDFIRVMQEIVRSSELRRGIALVVTKERASEFIENNKPTLETRPHKYYQFMLNRARETGIIPEGDVHRFFQITEGDAGVFLASYATTETVGSSHASEDEYEAGEIPQVGGNKTQFMGSAVFKEGKMIDILNGQETRIALILDPSTHLKDVLATYEDPLAEGFKIAARFIKKEKNDVDIQYHKEKPTVLKVTVPFEIEVLSVPSLIDYSNDRDKREKLRKKVEETLNEKANELVKKAQENYGTDPFYWSLYIRRFFPTIKDYEEGDWNHKIFPNAQIEVRYELKEITFGKLSKNSNLGEVRD